MTHLHDIPTALLMSIINSEVKAMISLPLSASAATISMYRAAGYVIEFYLDVEVD